MSLSTHSVRWLIEKILLFVLKLISMLLLSDHDNWVMEWTITGVVRQCPVTVSAVGLLSFFTLFCPFLKKYVASIALDFASSILQNWGSGKDFKEVHKISGPVIPRQVVEITTKWERLKKGKKYLITHHDHFRP